MTDGPISSRAVQEGPMSTGQCRMDLSAAGRVNEHRAVQDGPISIREVQDGPFSSRAVKDGPISSRKGQ